MSSTLKDQIWMYPWRTSVEAAELTVYWSQKTMMMLKNRSPTKSLIRMNWSPSPRSRLLTQSWNRN